MECRYKLFVQFDVKTTKNMLQNVNNNNQQIQLNHTEYSVYTIMTLYNLKKNHVGLIFFLNNGIKTICHGKFKKFNT